MRKVPGLTNVFLLNFFLEILAEIKMVSSFGLSIHEKTFVEVFMKLIIGVSLNRIEKTSAHPGRTFYYQLCYVLHQIVFATIPSNTIS